MALASNDYLRIIHADFTRALISIKTAFLYEIDITCYCKYTYDDDNNIIAYYSDTNNKNNRKVISKYTMDTDELRELRYITKYAETYTCYQNVVPESY